MTTDLSEPPEATDTLDTGRGAAIGPPARVQVRRVVVSAAVVVLVLGLAVVVAVVSAGGRRGYLDPGSAGPEGGRALRVLLEQQGVQVDVTSDAATATTRATAGTTVFVADAEWLSDTDLGRLQATGADLVLTDAAEPQIPLLVPGLSAGHGEPDAVREPACALPAATRAGPALTGGPTMTGQADAGELWSCYAVQGEATVVHQDLADGHSVTLVGSGTGFTNDALADDGNAALAMNLLGEHRYLVWFTAAPQSAPPADGRSTLTDLLPPWVGIALAQLAVCVLLAALWRGRRLGPVVVEPLPVDVRAAETTEGRARLYRRRGARDRAAEHLRAATLSRLLGPVGLPPTSGREAVVAQVAHRAGWTPGEVLDLLYGAAPRDDAGLVRLASDLDSLERQVRRP